MSTKQEVYRIWQAYFRSQKPRIRWTKEWNNWACEGVLGSTPLEAWEKWAVCGRSTHE